MTLEEDIPGHPLLSQKRYRTSDGQVVIGLKLRNSKQLFDSRDPAPFNERDLDDDAVDYLVSSVEEFPPQTPMKIEILLTEDSSADFPPSQLIQSIQNHFKYTSEILTLRLKHTFRNGRTFMFIGLSFLFVCISISEFSKVTTSPTLQTIFKEGFVIMGWVAMWRPLEIFLYDWWPIFEKRRYHRKLSTIEIEVHNFSTVPHANPT